MNITSEIKSAPRKGKKWLIIAGYAYYGIARDDASRIEKETAARAWLRAREAASLIGKAAA